MIDFDDAATLAMLAITGAMVALIVMLVLAMAQVIFA